MDNKEKQQPQWLPDVEEDNYPAAESYLSLIYSREQVEKQLVELRSAPLSQFMAKDMFRASGLPLLGISHFQIEKNLTKIQTGTGLSPLLLVRDSNNGKVVIADGYHRLCAVYRYNQEALIPCKIV
jgi:hypothetical protein